MSRPVTLENCTGACDQNPWGVCSHQYKCDHHIEQAKREAERQSWQDFVNGVARAPGLPRRNR